MQFQWTPDHQTAFDCFKRALSSALYFAYQNSHRRVLLDTDAPNSIIRAELTQWQEGKEWTIAYASHVVLPVQRKYCITRKNLLAVCRHFLLGRHYIIWMDHNSLGWFFRFRHIEVHLSRWLEELSRFDMQIVHRSGNRLSNADGLSHIPDK